jgi:UDP-glucuronate decarboxylase
MDILQQDIERLCFQFRDSEQFRDRTFVITGATGLLGTVTIKCLLALNEKCNLNLRIIAVVRDINKAVSILGPESDSLTFYIYDFASDEQFDLKGTVDYIIHFASPTASKFFVNNPVETIKTGINGTETILEYARANKPKCIVYVSSLEVYGIVTNDENPLTEDCQGYLDVADVRSSYPMAKRAAECMCHAYAEEYGLPVRIARLAQTFGAGVDKNDNRVFAQFARCVINNEDIVLHTNGKLKRSYCYTTDAINAIFYILLKGKDGDVYNVANEKTYISIVDMARFLCDEFNQKIKPVIQIKEGMGYSPDTKLRLDTTKLKNLGWNSMYDLHEMFENLIKWLGNRD